MKKLKTMLLIAFTAVVLILLASCKSALSVPTGVTIDMNNNLTWDAVTGARRYVLEITDVDEEKTKEYTTSKAKYSLSF